MTSVRKLARDALDVALSKIEDLEVEIDDLRGMLHSSETQRKLLFEILSEEQRTEFEKQLKAFRFKEKENNS